MRLVLYVYTPRTLNTIAHAVAKPIYYTLALAYTSDERGAIYRDGKGERVRRRGKDSQTTDPTLSLLRQLWCAVDVLVVRNPFSSSFFVTLMILNYCLMIYRFGCIWQKWGSEGGHSTQNNASSNA